MADMTSRPAASAQGNVSPGQREQIIREAAYFHAVQRGFAPGHELDDWLAAETELFGDEARRRLAQPPEAAEIEATEIEEAALDVQQGGAHGAWQHDTLKQIIRQHPRRAIPQIEAMDAREAPPRE